MPTYTHGGWTSRVMINQFMLWCLWPTIFPCGASQKWSSHQQGTVNFSKHERWSSSAACYPSRLLQLVLCWKKQNSGFMYGNATFNLFKQLVLIFVGVKLWKKIALVALEIAICLGANSLDNPWNRYRCSKIHHPIFPLRVGRGMATKKHFKLKHPGMGAWWWSFDVSDVSLASRKTHMALGKSPFCNKRYIIYRSSNGCFSIVIFCFPGVCHLPVRLLGKLFFLPSDKLTVRTWNIGVGRWVSFWGPASWQVLA